MPPEVSKRGKAILLTNEVRDEAARFAQFDLDGNVELDFEEFYSMQPVTLRQTRSTQEIREWFDLAAGGKETLSVNDFFAFSLSKASVRAGANSLRESFKRWDRDKTGYLDSVEFARAATEMGYGAVAHTLFKKLDSDNSGAISIDELEGALLTNSSQPGAQQLITSLVCVPRHPRPPTPVPRPGRSVHIRQPLPPSLPSRHSRAPSHALPQPADRAAVSIHCLVGEAGGARMITALMSSAAQSRLRRRRRHWTPRAGSCMAKTRPSCGRSCRHSSSRVAGWSPT